jgi:TonB family protein
MPRKSYLLFFCLFFIHIAARADDIKDTLSLKYKNQVMALRAPFTSGTQKFDSAGQSMNPRPQGPWLLYGGIYIQHIDLSFDTLNLDGPRVGFGDDKNGKPAGIALGDSVHVEIHLDQPLKSAAEAETMLNRVFYLDRDDKDHINRAKPEYRRADDSTSGEKLYQATDGIKLPSAIYHPAPEFSEKARQAKFKGIAILHIVIDKTGRIVRIRLERALGHGLDENAMKAVQNWSFNSGTKNGQPVAVEMNVEVSFHLY